MRQKYSKLPEVSFWRLAPYFTGALFIWLPGIYLKFFYSGNIQRINFNSFLAWLLLPSTAAGALVGWLCINTWKELPKAFFPVIVALIPALANFNSSDRAPVAIIMLAATQIPGALFGGFLGWSLKSGIDGETANSNE